MCALCFCSSVCLDTQDDEDVKKMQLTAVKWIAAFQALAVAYDVCEVHCGSGASVLFVLICALHMWQVWDYSASYAHMRTCMEVADSTSWATAKAYDIMCRRTWNSRAKRGACRAASVLEPLPTFGH